MNTPHRLLAATALVLACTAAAPRHAAAQGAAGAPAAGTANHCVRCIVNLQTGLFSCGFGYDTGGIVCVISAGGTMCEELGTCSHDAASTPIDGAVTPLSPELLENAVAGESAFALTHDGDGRSQYHAWCNGAVLARVYTPALADRLRTETSSIEL